MGGLVYHVLNRGNNRQRIFRKPADFAAFMKLLIEGKQRADVDMLGYCLMGNHWHLVLIPNGSRSGGVSVVGDQHTRETLPGRTIATPAATFIRADSRASSSRRIRTC